MAPLRIWRSGRISAATSVDADGAKVYKVSGELFFASMAPFTDLFHYQTDPDQIVIDFADSHVWDHSGVTAVAKVVSRYQSLGKQVTLVHLDAESERLIHRIGLVPSGH